VNDAQSRREAQVDGALTNNERVFGVPDTSADHRIDVDVKIGMLAEHLQ